MKKIILDAEQKDVARRLAAFERESFEKIIWGGGGLKENEIGENDTISRYCSVRWLTHTVHVSE